MPPAARVGDQTSHGTGLTPQRPPPGSLDVLIGKKPAWRALDDVHVCPLATGTVAHVGGPVLSGSTTVFINKRPAVRVGDAIVEAGPPNSIVTGCSTVLIGG